MFDIDKDIMKFEIDYNCNLQRNVSFLRTIPQDIPHTNALYPLCLTLGIIFFPAFENSLSVSQELLGHYTYNCKYRPRLYRFTELQQYIN